MRKGESLVRETNEKFLLNLKNENGKPKKKGVMCLEELAQKVAVTEFEARDAQKKRRLTMTSNFVLVWENEALWGRLQNFFWMSN